MQLALAAGLESKSSEGCIYMWAGVKDSARDPEMVAGLGIIVHKDIDCAVEILSGTCPCEAFGRVILVHHDRFSKVNRWYA